MILGIDTSNYTTSLALCKNGMIIDDCRRLLSVKPGERGLRQSEALFQHVKNLPILFEEITSKYSMKDLEAVGVSEAPRPIEGSYMPVFLAGIEAAGIISSSFQIPLYRFSHQENHIRAAMAGSFKHSSEVEYPLLAVHFSGGTSEILLVNPSETLGFDCKIVGKTLDLNAGQLVDRIGVALGLSFPAGKELEQIASRAKERKLIIPTRVESNGDFHFSGQENRIKQMLKKKAAPEDIAWGLFDSIGRTLSRSIRYIKERTNAKTVVFSGGVMANGLVKKIVFEKLKKTGLKMYFADSHYATDNAVGTALLAWEAFSEE